VEPPTHPMRVCSRLRQSPRPSDPKVRTASCPPSPDALDSCGQQCHQTSRSGKSAELRLVDQVAFAHVSDTHFDARIIPRAQGPNVGFHPHHLNLCRGLPLALRDVRMRFGLGAADPLNAVLSGDLSRGGGEGEFAVALSYLYNLWQFRLSGPGASTGLRLPPDQFASVPGNHDHWGRRWLPARTFNRTIVGNYFPRTVSSWNWQSTQTGIRLDVFGVDSNSGYSGSPLSISGTLAAGRISDAEFKELENSLQESRNFGLKSRTRCVRAILVHHSIAHRGHVSLGSVVTQELEQTSRDRLLSLAWRYEVAAILTGHVHDFIPHPWTTGSASSQRTVYELRCPTTLQGPGTNTDAGFLAHQVYLDQHGSTIWKWMLYRWQATRFIKCKEDRFPTP
jgi:hypothetical protein